MSSIWTPPSSGSVFEWGMFLAQALHLAQISKYFDLAQISHQSFDLAQIFFQSCPLANLIWMRTPGVILLNWIHTEKKFWFFIKRWNGENLLVRGSGPGCGKGNSSQGIPETNLVNKRIEEFRGWVPAKGCSWRFPATLCRQVFLPHKSTRPFAVEDTLDNRCRLDFLRVNGT